MSKNDSPAVVGRRMMEFVVAAIVIALGAVVIADSLRVGVGWAADGPRSGYFPFRVAIIMIAASLYVIARAVVGRTGAKVFVNREELARVATVLVPTIVFVAGVFVVGIYVSAALFIAAFMAMQGDRNLTRIGGVALGVPFVAYLLFEIWFLVPLPKGPLEDLLGL
jgi:putative tricarboxylic transport membrane protein